MHQPMKLCSKKNVHKVESQQMGLGRTARLWLSSVSSIGYDGQSWREKLSTSDVQ